MPKTISEIEEILNQYSSGPVVKIAAKDALAWAKAARNVCLRLAIESKKTNPTKWTEEAIDTEVFLLERE